MATLIEFLIEGVLEIIFALGGVRFAIILLSIVFTVFFIATDSYLSAAITGGIGLITASTFKKPVKVRIDD